MGFRYEWNQRLVKLLCHWEGKTVSSDGKTDSMTPLVQRKFTQLIGPFHAVNDMALIQYMDAEIHMNIQILIEY